MASADAGSRKDEQAVLRQQGPQFLYERQDHLMAAIHDGAATNLDDLHPRQEPDRAAAGDRASEIAIEQGLARERRGDVLDLVDVGHGDGPLQLAVMMVPTCSPASARVRLPGTRPFTICTSRT